MNKRKYKDYLYQLRQISDIKDLVESSASLFADKTAFYIKDIPGGEYKPISYKQLKEDIDALGTAFIHMGFKDKKIALIGENSYEWVVTYFAVVNGTGVVVPLDKELHPKEINALLTRSKAAVAVYSKKTKAVIDEAKTGVNSLEQTIVMTDLPGLIEKGRQMVLRGDTSFTGAEIDPRALCALLYTSGTTGLAKGVMLSHENIALNVYNMSTHVKISENGIGLSVLPMHHTYELTCHILTGLYQGVGIAICEGLKHIVGNMAEIKATVMLGVPLVFESMHKKIWKQAEASGKAEKMRKAIKLSKMFKLYNHPKIIKKMFKQVHAVTGGNIEMFIAGGAGINPKVVEDLEAMGFPMIQGYGLTESSPIIAANKDRYSKSNSVGFAVPGTEIKIINPDENGIGEIICKGPSIMLGYYEDPDESAKVLKEGWLYTGDYGYFDEDGMLYISGRKKNVIVTKNGKNIFPEEVEFYLGQSPYILEALVYGAENEKTGDTIVKASIVPDYESITEEKGELAIDEIRDIIKGEIDNANELMTAYKRVKRFDIRETEFAKTTTRKIKRYEAENVSGPIMKGEEK